MKAPGSNIRPEPQAASEIVCVGKSAASNDAAAYCARPLDPDEVALLENYRRCNSAARAVLRRRALRARNTPASMKPTRSNHSTAN